MQRSATRLTLALIGLALSSVPAPAEACDMCAIYNATDVQDGAVTGVRVGIAEQYSSYGTLQQGGDEVDNPGNQHLHSSITQLVLGYQPLDYVGVQLNLPIIARRFRRDTEGGSEHGTESGVGDLNVLVRYRPLALELGPTSIRGWLLAGVELPTGSTDRLGEEADEHEENDDGEHDHVGVPWHVHHDEVMSGVHGHDLALGSGSVDGFFGAELLFLWDRIYLHGSVQYRLRTRGSFEYRYADELTAQVGPGVFLFTDHQMSLALRAAVAVDTKGNDDLRGKRANDTALTALYAGPGLQFTWRDDLNLDFGADIPAVMNNSGLQVVPDYRLRGGVTWLF